MSKRDFRIIIKSEIYSSACKLVNKTNLFMKINWNICHKDHNPEI